MKYILCFGLFVVTASAYPQLSNDEIAGGLKEALTIGAKQAVKSASKHDGFNGNPAIRISFPPETGNMESTLRQAGMGAQVDQFTTSLNRAAEEATKAAVDILISAIQGITIDDGKSILKGGNTAATLYLAEKTHIQLYHQFKPIVQEALGNAQSEKYWTPLANTYNKVPFVEKVNPDLIDYTTNKSMEGLFKLIAKEEENIRTLGAARVTETLQKVFGGG